MSTVNANCGMSTKRFHLEEGSLEIRSLGAAEVEQLRQIEADNLSDPTRAIARYMPLIQAATVKTATWEGASIPCGMKSLDYILSCTTSGGTELLPIIYGLYYLTKLQPPACGIPPAIETKTIQLIEGTITLRPIQADDLRVSEAVTRAAPERVFVQMSSFIQCIFMAALEVKPLHPELVPADATPLDYMLDNEPKDGLWRIVRTMYEMAGMEFPADFAGNCEAGNA